MTANDIKNKILENKDYDEISKNLELLDEFIYKAPQQVLYIVDIVLRKKLKPKELVKGIYGKEHKDLVLECIGLLEKIRYIKLPKVFDILVGLYHNKDEQIKSKAVKALERVAKYDYYVVTRIKAEKRYFPQEDVLKIVGGWDENEKIKNIDIIKILAKEMLKSSFTGVSMKDYKTMVFHSGPLTPNSALIKIRKKAMELLFECFNVLGSGKDNIKSKVSLLQVLYDAADYPNFSTYGKDMEKMIKDSVVYLTKRYKEVAFINNKKLIDVPIIQEIERQLVRFNKNHKTEIPEISKLLCDVREDDFYSLYRILVGDTLRLDRIEKESWQEAEIEIKKKIDAEFKKINDKNIKAWIEKLNSIAGYEGVIEDWHLQNFRGFLFRIAKRKPEQAKKILDDALDNKKPIRGFVSSFLRGFMIGEHKELWKDYTKKIEKLREPKLVVSIPLSLPAEIITKNDISYLAKIIAKEKPFDFLKDADKVILRQLHYSLLRTIIYASRQDEKQVEKLVIALLKEDENKYMYGDMRYLGFPAYDGRPDLSKWSSENIEFILGKLVEIPKLEHDAQLVLFAIAKFNFEGAIQVFKKRIDRRVKKREDDKKWILSLDYDAIPYHFNDDLIKYIDSKKGETVKIVKKWLENMTPKSSVFNIELAQFIQRIGSSFGEILNELVKKGSPENLQKAVKLMWSIKSPNIKLCFDIIKKTNGKQQWGKRIIADLIGLMHNTGVVSGEYGISKALENKASAVEKIAKEIKGTSAQMKRVDCFGKEVVRSLKDRAKQEHQRADEEIRLRKLEFEE